jgi:hypothetical protein
MDRRLLLRASVLIGLALMVTLPPAKAGDINGYSPAHNDRFSSGFPTAPVSNTNNPAFILPGADLSGVGWDVGNPIHSFTMISPVHFIAAAHFPFSNEAVRFLDSAGNVVNDVVVSATPVAGSDVLLGKLQNPVPSTVKFYPIPQGPDAVFLDRDIYPYGQFNPSNPQNAGYSNSPHVGHNNVTSIQDNSGTRIFTYDYNPLLQDEYYLVSGDSGGPTFLPTGPNQLALLGGHYANTSPIGDPYHAPTLGDFSADTFLPFYVDQLNNLMQPDGYSVTLVPVPEPGPLALMGLVAAVAGVGYRLRSRCRLTVKPAA